MLFLIPIWNAKIFCKSILIYFDIHAVGQAMVALNVALEGDNPDSTLQQLLNPVLNLASVNPSSRCLYHEELQSLKEGASFYIHF